MNGLTSGEIAKVAYRYIGVSSEGYLGDFSYAKHAQFYPLYCDLDIDPNALPGTTRERFISVLTSQTPADQAKIIRGVVERFPVGGPAAPDTRTEEEKQDLLAMAARLAGIQVPGVKPAISRDSVIRAIEDADVLIGKNGMVSAIDRVHTTLHGYLLSVCDAVPIPYPPDPTMAKLLKLVRQGHPKFASLGPRGTDIERVLNACATIMDAMNPLRNQTSVAHPNPVLLDEAEARLVVNTGRTLLAYLDAKLS